MPAKMAFTARAASIVRFDVRPIPVKSNMVRARLAYLARALRV